MWVGGEEGGGGGVWEREEGVGREEGGGGREGGEGGRGEEEGRERRVLFVTSAIRKPLYQGQTQELLIREVLLYLPVTDSTARSALLTGFNSSASIQLFSVL